MALVFQFAAQVDKTLARHAELLKKYTDTEMHNILAYLMTAQ